MSREHLPNRGQADALAHMVDVALLGLLPIQPFFLVLLWRKVGQQFVDGEPLGPGQPNFVIQGGEMDYASSEKCPRCRHRALVVTRVNWPLAC